MYVDQPIFKNPDLTDDTLVGSWLCPGVSRSAKDYSTEGNDGAAVGVRWDKVGGYFDGSSHIAVPDDATLDLTSQVTLEAFVKVGSFVGYQRIISKRDTSPNDGYELLITNTDYASFEIGDSSVVGTSVLIAGRWYYIVGIYDGSYIRILINGRQENSAERTGAIPTNANDVQIGRDGLLANPFTGNIACANIYNTGKTEGFAKERWYSAIPEGQE